NRGLFGYISGGTVKNLGLENVNVSGTNNIGSIAGTISFGSLIEHSYVIGIVAGVANVGGIAGTVSASTIRNSWTSTKLDGSDYVGGIAGYLISSPIVQNCVSLGPEITRVSGNGTSFGRILGNVAGTVSGNAAYANMSLIGNFVTGTHSDRNGLNISIESILADGTLGTRFAMSPPWVAENGRLPGFHSGIALPLHLFADAMRDFLPLVNGTSYITLQALASDKEAAKLIVHAKILELAPPDISVSIIDAEGTSFIAALPGESTLPLGTNGRYEFRVSISDLGESEMLTLTIIATPHSSFSSGGGGIAEHPYLIQTASQLETIRARINNNVARDKHYRLASDIVLSSTWIPIGNIINPFQGVFDGAGHKIENLLISEGSNRGLFGYISGGTVKNLGLENVNVSGANYVGSIAGTISSGSLIEHSYVMGTVVGAADVGGIVGLNDGSTIKSSWSSVSVTGTDYFGGIVGNMSTASAVENCAALGPEILQANGTSTNFGRISGNDFGIFSGNIAYSEMLTPDAIMAGNNKNGLSRTLNNLLMSSFYPQSLVETPWVYESGKLPGLSTPIELPAHLSTARITLHIRKDGVEWPEHGKNFSLILNDTEVKITGGSTLATNVTNGTWQIYEGDNLIGEIEAGSELTLNYYTVIFSLALASNAHTSSTITATYNGKNIASGDVVLGGGMLVLNAQGEGAEDYTYLWSGSGSTNQILSVPNLSGAVDALCTITGTGSKVLAGRLIISNTKPKIGDWLTVSLENGNYEGSLIYKWFSGEDYLDEMSAYTVATTDENRVIRVEASAITGMSGTLVAFTEPVSKRSVEEADFEYTITNHIYGEAGGVSVAKRNSAIGDITVLYNDSEEVPVNAGEYLVLIRISGNSTYKEGVFELGLYIIEKIPGTFLAHNLIADVYEFGLTLEALLLNSSYKWDSPETLLNAGNGQSFAVTYTHESGNYTTVPGFVTVNIAKATPLYTEPSNLTASYGEILEAVDLEYGWSWENLSLSVGNAGENKHKAIFTPEDTYNYNIVHIDLTINVAKAIPANIVFPITNSIVYNSATTLLQIAFEGGEGDGTFTWKDAETVPVVNNSGYIVVFTPSDAENYETLTETLTLEVKQAPGSFIAPSNAVTAFHTLTLTLSDITLPSGYEWSVSPSVLNALLNIGNHSLPAIYTCPSGNYQPAEGYLRIAITDATSILQPPSPDARTGVAPAYYNLHGQPLGTAKPTAPGVYIEKHGNQTKRVTVW
ncbi:MAG: hypothetical protein LBC85_06930, partial [Fibromonadaceae bacterium]|nr:hypothetical protein [Fibromonadaceae bacterium]